MVRSTGGDSDSHGARAFGAVSAVCRFFVVPIDPSVDATTGKADSQERVARFLLVRSAAKVGLTAEVESTLCHDWAIPTKSFEMAPVCRICDQRIRTNIGRAPCPLEMPYVACVSYC